MNLSLSNKIDRYFEADLSPQEERELLHQLLPLEGTDPAIDEALAVMLASRLHSAAPASGRRPWKKVAVAAAIVTALAVGGLVHHLPPSDRSGMIAYVGGVRIENPQEIMKIIDTQLNEIGESSEFISRTVSADLDDIRDALNSEGI